MMRILWLIIALVLVWGPILPGTASAAVVGRLTQVEGRVDILKGGKLPATPVKVGDRVDAGDVLRSKSLSRAQITFIDNSIINISPGSRLAIEDYRFEPDQGKRWAVLKIFMGLAHVVVNKIFKVEEPDFIVKTHTAVTGVRGTDFGVRLSPNSSTILNFEGKTRVGNIFPEVLTWEQRAQKIAFQPPGGGSFFVPGGYVDLKGMQGTTVQSNLPPTLPFALTPLDRQQFMNQVATGLPSQPGGTGGGVGTVAGGTRGGASGGTVVSDTGPGTSSLGLTTGTGDTAVTLLNTVTVPPVVTPASGGGSNPAPSPPGPTPSTFSFSQQYYGAWITLSDSPYNQSTLTGYAWGSRTGVYDGYFYNCTEGTRTATSGTTFPTINTGTNTATATGTVTGFLGQTLTGTMDWTSTVGGTTITRTGNVTILSTGETTYVWTDTLTNSGTVVATGSGTTAQTPGTHFTQTLSGQEVTTANLAGNQATNTNSGLLTGNRAIDGMANEIINGGFSVTSTAPNADTFSSNEPHQVEIASEGVLGAPDTNGVRTGVMTSTITAGESTTYNGGPVRDVPASGDSPAATFKQVIGNSAAGGSTLGVSATTTDLSSTIVTTTYEGSGTSTSEPPYTTAIHNSTGWGTGTAPSGEGSINTDYTGTLNATVTRADGQTFNPSDTDIVRHTAVAVLSGGSGTHQGPAQGVGVAGENTVLSTTGTVTANPSTGVISTNNLKGTWVEPDGKGNITAGTLTMTPGQSFQLTTNTSAGQVTLSEPSGTGPYTQTITPTAAMTATGGAGLNTNQALSGTITSTTNTAGALPPAANVPTNINIQGVVNPSTGAGNMTMTTHPASGGAVSTYMGPVNISAGTLATPPTKSLVGTNPANPGVNRVPADQTGTVATTTP